MVALYMVLILLVAIFGCYEGIYLYRQQKKGGKEIDMVNFVIKIVLLMILIGLLIKMTNWVFSTEWLPLS